jgi:hypothetical protein
VTSYQKEETSTCSDFSLGTTAVVLNNDQMG